MQKKHIQHLASLLLCLGLLLSWQPGLVQAATGDLTISAVKTTVDGNERFVVSVSVDAPANLYGVQFSLSYDNTSLKVINLSPGSAWPAGKTFVARQSFTSAGGATESIEFAATLTDPTLTVASDELLSIVFEAIEPASGATTPVSSLIQGGTALGLLLSDAAGASLTPAVFANNVTININRAPKVEGSVTLQSPGSRTVTVSGVSLSGQDSVNVASGAGFALSLPSTAGTGASYELTASADCHLSAKTQTTLVSSPSDNNNITLLAGDVNGDNRINIQDLAAMGNLFGSAPGSLPCTDLDESGTVNILDLSRAASNYGQEGPLDWGP